jgi:RNA polymerase sigma factor (sigma-70 family)
LPTPSPSTSPSPATTPEPLSIALEAVVTRFASLVRKVGWRHGLHGDDLDEVMQDVRLRLWRARGTSEQIRASSASYVYRTATTAALDVIRRRRRTIGRRDAVSGRDTDNPEAAIDQLPSAQPGAGSPEDQLAASEVAQAVGAAVSRIPASRRPVVRMYLIGHPQMEIATLMGWSEPKTRNLLYRGLADLRAELTAMGYGPGEAVT